MIVFNQTPRRFRPCWNYQNRAGGSQLTAGGMVLRTDPRMGDSAETVTGACARRHRRSHESRATTMQEV